MLIATQQYLDSASGAPQTLGLLDDKGDLLESVVLKQPGQLVAAASNERVVLTAERPVDSTCEYPGRLVLVHDSASSRRFCLPLVGSGAIALHATRELIAVLSTVDGGSVSIIDYADAGSRLLAEFDIRGARDLFFDNDLPKVFVKTVSEQRVAWTELSLVDGHWSSAESSLTGLLYSWSGVRLRPDGGMAVLGVLGIRSSFSGRRGLVEIGSGTLGDVVFATDYPPQTQVDAVYVDGGLYFVADQETDAGVAWLISVPSGSEQR
jgi:hypothetical protein